ncbi:telomerase RNA component interacting RNase-like [Dendronephthya gigantea]|uniref:telomerase RNA component interacting RNase-like n=1 Tax=Dendronephthya gigantea TaxID=151771 RepID=UPI00106D4131|nr:telomerase RNA component interacting RNase-like [Dendronephthya gigantea]
MASENVEKCETSKTNKSMNSFVNDGSFFEIYKQRLKEQKNVADKKTENTAETEAEKRKTANLLLQGKRKIPVGRMPGSSKKLDAKKKKLEKKKEENPDEKSSAWKAYMEEVKKYKEMSCTDDTEQNRPLVK